MEELTVKEESSSSEDLPIKEEYIEIDHLDDESGADDCCELFEIEEEDNIEDESGMVLNGMSGSSLNVLGNTSDRNILLSPATQDRFIVNSSNPSKCLRTSTSNRVKVAVLDPLKQSSPPRTSLSSMGPKKRRRYTRDIFEELPHKKVALMATRELILLKEAELKRKHEEERREEERRIARENLRELEQRRRHWEQRMELERKEAEQRRRHAEDRLDLERKEAEQRMRHSEQRMELERRKMEREEEIHRVLLESKNTKRLFDPQD